MHHFLCVKVMDYLHLFNLNGLSAKLLFSQDCIPCNLCHFNIREFALKKGVSSFIILNPFFLPCLSYCPTRSFPFSASLLLSFFMSYLSCCPSPFYCPSQFILLFGVLVILALSLFPSFYHAFSIGTHALSLSPSFLSCCNTHHFSFFMPYLTSHAYTHTFPFLSCMSYHTLT